MPQESSMKTAFAVLAALLLFTLAPVASAGVVQSTACASAFAWGNPTVDALWQATTGYGCTVVTIVAEPTRDAACAGAFAWGNPTVDALWQATTGYGCAVVTILV